MSVKIITFGCRYNKYESEIIKDFLQKKNLDDKNIVIFNSCTVTQEAEKQLKQMIRRIKRNEKDVIIGVVGCAVQTNTDDYYNMPEIDFIFGNIDKMNDKNYDFLQNDINLGVNKKSLVTNINTFLNQKQYLLSNFSDRVRAFVQIQTGCNNNCTFCATRLARGKSISLKSQYIIEQINKLVNNGYNEIVLTGINITDYGTGLDENINLGKLIKLIISNTSLTRLRLSSLDISNMNDDLKDVLFNETKVMPHIHLSIQSGDDLILKRMNRKYLRQDIINFCEEIKKYRSNIGIGADFIAGFPTEDEKMHQNSYDLIDKIEIPFCHIFPYSIRNNTPASLMKQVPINIRKDRAKELRTLSNLKLEKFILEQSKLPHSIIIESKTKARTENYISLNLDQIDIKKKYNIGDIVSIDHFQLLTNNN